MSEILFIPGLGEGGLKSLQRNYLSFLDLIGKSSFRFFDPRWTDENESANEKLERLNRFYSESGDSQVIFAASAGAALAVNLLGLRSDLTEIHLVCGKLRRPELIGPEFSKRAPHLIGVVESCQQIVDEPGLQHKITSYTPPPPDDGVIQTQDMLAGSNIQLPNLNHATAIGYAMVRYLPRI